MKWARAHWIVGVVTLAFFPLTGQYMRHVAGVPHLEDVTRLVFRSRHLFLLMAGVANIALSNSQSVHRAQKAASVLIMTAPIFLAAAFFIDPARGIHSSTIFRIGMYEMWIAGVMLAIVNRPFGESVRRE
ncbi:MAG: hypothetical protein WBS24_03805 [Terriglobales bacterium]